MKELAALVSQLPEFQSLLSAIDSGACPAAVSGLSGVHRAHFAAGVRRETGRSVVVVCADETDAQRMAADLSALLGEEVHCLSIMPNTPVSVGEGVVLVEDRHNLTSKEFDTVWGLLSSLGTAVCLPSGQMGIAGTISGCGPAYAAMFLEALGDAGVLHGLPRELSYRLAAQMLAGAGKLQLETGAHPGAMKDGVCSPGGTTIQGVRTLEGRGFRSAAMEAVLAAYEKTLSMGQ